MAVEYKFDGYLNRDLAYKMTLEDLHERSQMYGISEEDFTAYLRYRDGKVTFLDKSLIHFRAKKPIEIMLITESKRDSYNPISDTDDGMNRNGWYGPYKMVFAPVSDPSWENSAYVSDFVSLINLELIEILEKGE
jgi:hypothetical protein